MKPTDHFYENQPEPLKSIFLSLRGIIGMQDQEISETIKYGIPCFLYRKKIMCYIWRDKKTQEPYILWNNGLMLDHPDLELGGRKRMKILRINPHADLPVETIQAVLETAIDIIRKKWFWKVQTTDVPDDQF